MAGHGVGRLRRSGEGPLERVPVRRPTTSRSRSTRPTATSRNTSYHPRHRPDRRIQQHQPRTGDDAAASAPTSRTSAARSTSPRTTPSARPAASSTTISSVPSATSIRRRARHQHDPARQDDQLLRQRAFPDQQRLAGVRAGAVFERRIESGHSAGPGVRPVRARPAQRHPDDDHAAADQRVLPARNRRRGGYRRTAAQRPLPDVRQRWPRSDRHERTLGLRRRDQGYLGELGLGRVRFLRGGQDDRADQQRFPGLSAPAADPEQRSRQLFRSEHARHRGARAVAELYRRRDPRRNRRTTAAQIKTSGEIYKLPAGPLALAFGLEDRKETLRPDHGRGTGRAATITGLRRSDQVDPRQGAHAIGRRLPR